MTSLILDARLLERRFRGMLGPPMWPYLGTVPLLVLSGVPTSACLELVVYGLVLGAGVCYVAQRPILVCRPSLRALPGLIRVRGSRKTELRTAST